MDASSRYAICADELLDGLGGDPIHDAAVLVQDGRIVAAGERESLELRDAQVFEHPGCTILPGLIDPHVHLALRPELSQDESISFAQTATQSELLEVMGVNAARAFAAGVTTVRDCGSPGASGVAFRALAAADNGRVPRVLVSGRPITTSTGHCQWMGKVANSEAEVVSAVTDLCAEGVDFIKVMATGGMMTPGSDPWQAQYSAETLTSLVRAAHDHGRRVAAHALSSPGVRAALAARVDTIEHCVTTTAAAQDFDPQLAPALAAAGIVVGVTAHNPLRTLLAQGDIEGVRRRLAPHRLLREAGVELVIHSDAGPPGTEFDGLAESVEIFCIGLGASVSEAIAAATAGPAATLGLQDMTGALRPGLAADVLVVRGLVSADVRALRHPTRVIRAGVSPPREELLQ